MESEVAKLIQSKTVSVKFKDLKTSELLATLMVDIEPQRNVINGLFRFFAVEKTFMTQCIRLTLDGAGWLNFNFMRLISLF